MNKTLFCCVAYAAMLCSCAQESLLELNPQLESVTKEHSIVDIRFNQEGVAVKSGSLVFKDLDVFMAQSIEIANMSKVDFEAWEESIGFTSFRTKMSNLETLMDMLGDESSEVEFALKNPLFFEVAGDSYEPKIKANLYRSIVNEDGVYFIGTTKHIVDGEKVSVSTQSKSIIESAYVNTATSKKSQRAEIIEYDRREKSVRDRRVMTSAKMIKQVGFNNEYQQFALGIEVFVDGMKKGPVKWKHYSTVHFMRQGYVSVNNAPLNVVDGNVIYGFDDHDFPQEENSGDCKNWTRTITLGPAIRQDFQIRQASRLEYQAYTRGTDVHNYLQYIVVDGITQ